MSAEYHLNMAGSMTTPSLYLKLCGSNSRRRYSFFRISFTRYLQNSIPHSFLNLIEEKMLFLQNILHKLSQQNNFNDQVLRFYLQRTAFFSSSVRLQFSFGRNRVFPEKFFSKNNKKEKCTVLFVVSEDGILPEAGPGDILVGCRTQQTHCDTHRRSRKVQFT